MTDTGKSKWDQPGPPSNDATPEASGSSKKLDPAEAAAQAAAIAAKIAAQFAAGGALDGLGGPAEHAFVKDIDINDVRNRYMLTKGSTQQQVNLKAVTTRYIPPC